MTVERKKFLVEKLVRKLRTKLDSGTYINLDVVVVERYCSLKSIDFQSWLIFSNTHTILRGND